MSTTPTGTGVLAANAPISRRVRAFFAPVVRAAGAANIPSVWDPALMGFSSLDAMPAPWIDLGPIVDFKRLTGTEITGVRAGSPPTARRQARTGAAASVEFAFERWGKLQLALSCGVQQMNVLVPATGASPAASGAVGTPATALLFGTGVNAQSATVLQVGVAAAATFSVGQMVAVDLDYSGQTGFIGSGVSGAFVQPGSAVSSDPNFVRRFTLNVGLITSISGGALTLAQPLIAGVPTSGMKVSSILGFVDREGGGFFQEWSGLFITPGEQGDRICFFYPRLQASTGIGELSAALPGKASALQRTRLNASFRALAARDSVDGQMSICYRSYLPANMQDI